MTRTPITLITGSLGSGKTTLLKNILDSADRRLAVLMNEFGEIGIDTRIIQGRNIAIRELAGGCVCCSLTGELEEAVAEIIDTIRPELIVLEATGVAEADALVFEVEDNLPGVRLDTVICLVDAYTSVHFPQVGYVAAQQIQAADILLINKTDLISSEEVEDVERQVRLHNKSALILKTDHCRVDLSLLLDSPVQGRSIHKDRRPLPKGSFHSKHLEEGQLESFAFSTGRTMDRDKLRRFLDGLPAEVFRAKGFIRFPDSSELFNYVMGRQDFEAFPAEETQIVFIGPNLLDKKDSLLRQLKECEHI